MTDELKRQTIQDYSAWDLNCKVVSYRPRLRRKLTSLFKRKARRKMNQEVKNDRA